jgi:tetratricopeptide (TPR) repeat protein
VNPQLHAALLHYPKGADARRELLRLRHEPTLTQAERLQAAEKLAAADARRASALWLIAAHRAAPQDARIAYRLGNALRMAGRERAAATTLTKLVKTHPDWHEPALSLAWLYRRRGEGEAAADVMESWFSASGSRLKALFPVSAFLEDMGLVARAEALLARSSSHVEARAERGNLLVKLGRFDEAESVLRGVVAENPADGGAWLRLAMVRHWRDAAASPRALMRAGLRRAGLDEPTRAAIGFALAKVNDDLGDYAAAWRTAEWANGLRSRGARFHRTAWSKYEQAVYRIFIPRFFSRLGDSGRHGEAPIFIVGMPRSGTTMLEQRLARHSQLTSAGELEVIEALGIEAAGKQGYPAGISAITPARCGDLASQWRARLPAALPRAGIIIDKNPLNFLHLGWIACLFPRARIIHCRRDPLDTALSLWFQNFAHQKNDYAYRKEDIAWMYALYQRLMAHWDRVLSCSVRTLDYEQIIADPEAELRALVAWLGLDWEPAILSDSFVEEAAISTASLWQARQPMYGHSVARARRYEPWIAPLRDALRAAGVSND